MTGFLHGPSLLPRRELLTSQLDDDGLWHAVYRTALSTLCGLTAHPEKGLQPPPDCPTCDVASREFDRIDRSRPSHWDAYVVAHPKAAA